MQLRLCPAEVIDADRERNLALRGNGGVHTADLAPSLSQCTIDDVKLLGVEEIVGSLDHDDHDLPVF